MNDSNGVFGIAKSGFSKRMSPVSIGFGEIGDVSFVTTDAVASIIQGMFSC